MGNLSARRSNLIRSMALPALLSACSTLAPREATALPAGAIALAAPAIYLEWYQSTEGCSGLTGEFSTVKFYVVPGVETFSTDAGQKAGEWIQDGGTNLIVIAGNYQNHEMVVRHELLHSLLRRVGHPQEYFVTKCRLTWESWDSLDAPVAIENGG